MFVQGEQDIGKAVHEAAGGLAPNGLRKRGSQYIAFLPYSKESWAYCRLSGIRPQPSSLSRHCLLRARSSQIITDPHSNPSNIQSRERQNQRG